MLKHTSIVLALLAIAITAHGADRKQNHLGPIYVHPKPEREVPVFERPQFERRIRERSDRERPQFETTARLKQERVKPEFEPLQQEKPQWDKTVLETKWERDDQPILEEFPKERRIRKVAGRHTIRRGVRVR